MLRYQEFSEVIQDENGKRRYSTLYYPSFDRRDTDIFIQAKLTDRLDLLAHQYYGDARYWVVIAKANKLHNATIRVPVGFRLRIPYPLRPDDISTNFKNAQF